MALIEPTIATELIVDFGFVAAAWVQLAIALAPDRVLVVSDSVGEVDPHTSFNGTVLVPAAGDILVRESDGAVWSSNSTIADAVRRLRSLGHDWPTIAALTSQNLLRHLGRDNTRWSDRLMAPGGVANLVLLDASGAVQATVIQGRLAHLLDPDRLR
jgi:N-acetylglucosamine-6-phosphate deacetylase